MWREGGQSRERAAAKQAPDSEPELACHRRRSTYVLMHVMIATRAGCGVRWEKLMITVGESPNRSKPSRRVGGESCERRGNAGFEA